LAQILVRLPAAPTAQINEKLSATEQRLQTIKLSPQKDSQGRSNKSRAAAERNDR
jgi:hypothetical protein